MELKKQIHRLRTEKKLSQNELAEALGVSRQSVSKWELGSSIPDLDKLVGMSELFGVSLDELVNGEEKQPETEKPAAEEASPAIYHTVIRETHPLRQVVGIILLCLSALLLLVCLLAYGDFLSGLVLGLPFAVCGAICLIVRRPGLWCAWAIGLLAWFVMPAMTGIMSRGSVWAWLKGYIPFGPQVIGGFVSMLYALALLLATVHRYYKVPMQQTGRWCLICGGLLVTMRVAGPFLFEWLMERSGNSVAVGVPVSMAIGGIRFLLELLTLLFAARWLYQRKQNKIDSEFSE